MLVVEPYVTMVPLYRHVQGLKLNIYYCNRVNTKYFEVKTFFSTFPRSFPSEINLYDHHSSCFN